MRGLKESCGDGELLFVGSIEGVSFSIVGVECNRGSGVEGTSAGGGSAAD